MYTLRLLISLILCLLYLSCADEPTPINTPKIDRHLAMQRCISSIEYDLYTHNRGEAVTHMEDWLHLLNSCDTEYCKEDQDQVVELVKDIAAYHQVVTSGSQERRLAELRTLKAQFMQLNTTEQVETYIYDLWSYEEEMYYATKAAMDPMLDLYEWAEFEQLVLCLNQQWDLVQLHYPSLEFMYGDHLAYKMQTSAKIELQKSMAAFNAAVANDDYQTAQLDQSARKLRVHYMQYLMTLVSYDDQKEFYF